MWHTANNSQFLSFIFFDRLYGMFFQFVIGLIHRSCTVDQITAFSSFQYKYSIVLDRLEHETSREQFHKQSRPETASHYRVDKATAS